MAAADVFVQGPIGGGDCEPVCIKDIDAGVSIEAVPSGLRTDFRITTQVISDVASTLPSPTALTARNAMSLTNLDASNTLYIGKSNVTADRALGTTAGWEVGPGESFNLDVTDAITLYGVTEAGKTVLVKIMEVS